MSVKTDERYRASVARIRSTVPSHWLLEAQRPRLSDSEVRAIRLALDELDSYIGVMSEDIAEVESEARLEVLRWASRKLHALTEPA